MSPAARTARRIREYLDNLNVAYEPTAEDTVKVNVGTTAVFISAEWRAERTVVGLVAPVLADVDASAEQLVDLLELNAELSFGKFSWYPEERIITVEYELLGDFLDRDELAVALQAVGSIADISDERLQGLLGGRLPQQSTGG